MQQLKEQTNKNIYGKFAHQYLDKGFSIIPDKFMQKQPAIKEWSKYCYQLPTSEEVESWINQIPESNIAIALGEASGIIALDVDTTDRRILDIIEKILPPSPVEKKGAKGFTRFFRYKGETTDSFKHNGEMIIELLSNNKKTTIPPSVHPNGYQYTWTNKELLDIEVEKLPLFPPFLMAHLSDTIRASIPDTQIESRTKTFSGRNDALSSYCGELISRNEVIDSAVRLLIEFDEKNNETPLFSDPNEFQHTEKFTNALVFYSNHLSTANAKHFRKNEEYEIPITGKGDLSVGKSQAVSEKKSKSNESLTVENALVTCICCGKQRSKF